MDFGFLSTANKAVIDSLRGNLRASDMSTGIADSALVIKIGERRIIIPTNGYPSANCTCANSGALKIDHNGVTYFDSQVTASTKIFPLIDYGAWTFTFNDSSSQSVTVTSANDTFLLNF